MSEKEPWIQAWEEYCRQRWAEMKMLKGRLDPQEHLGLPADQALALKSAG